MKKADRDRQRRARRAFNRRRQRERIVERVIARLEGRRLADPDPTMWFSGSGESADLAGHWTVKSSAALHRPTTTPYSPFPTPFP